MAKPRKCGDNPSINHGSLMISADRHWIFVHIQKTGGNSICSAPGVEFYDPHKHFFARELRDIYGNATWEACFKFAFVRNPWDRLVSWWSMIDARRHAVTPGRQLNKFHHFVLERATCFEEFLDNCDEEIVDGDGRKWIYRNQVDYLTDLSGAMLVDFVGRFETLEQDFAAIARRILTSPVRLPYVNGSKHLHYSQYYTPAQAEKVAQRYARDIVVFGYKFEHTLPVGRE